MKACNFLLIFLSSIAVYGQEVRFRDDTISIQVLIKGEQNFKKLDYTSMEGFQQYRPFGRNRLPMARSGNIGLPVHSYRINYQDWDVNANLGGYQAYLMSKDSMKFYQASRPITFMNYANGSSSEQLFEIMHTQNLGEGLNVSLNYRRIVSEGFFQNQLTSHTQFNATFYVKSRNQRFLSKAYYFINNLKSQENGGVGVFDNTEDNSILLRVNLNTAQNKSRSTGFGVENSYDLIVDSNQVFLNISHEIGFNRSYRIFKDQFEDNSFHSNFFIDTTRTADSSYAEVFSNQLMLNFFNKKLNVGFRNEQYHHFQNFLLNRNFQSNYLVFHSKGEVFNRQMEAYLEKGISGFHEDELDFSSRIELTKWNKINFSLAALVRNKQADLFIQSQRTNHHFFDRDFETSNQSALLFHVLADHLNLTTIFGVETYENYIFYNSQIEPTQLASRFSVLSADVKHKLHFFRYLNFNNSIRYQSIEEKEFIPLPSLYSFHSFYFDKAVFGGALQLQFGLDYYYIGEYSGFAYSPSLTQFYLSETEEKLGGNGQLDFFINLRIEKAARVFIKMENILNEEFSPESMRIQNYSIPGRVLKVGFSWRMIN